MREQRFLESLYMSEWIYVHGVQLIILLNVTELPEQELSENGQSCNVQNSTEPD